MGKISNHRMEKEKQSEVDGIAPEFDGTAPEVDGTAPEFDGTAPEAEVDDGTAPEVDRTAPSEENENTTAEDGGTTAEEVKGTTSADEVEGTALSLIFLALISYHFPPSTFGLTRRFIFIASFTLLTNSSFLPDFFKE